MVATGGEGFGEEGVADAGKARASSGDVNDAGVHSSTMFTGVIFVIARGCREDAVPRGTLLHKAQESKVIGRSPLCGRIGNQLVNGIQIHR